jgi:hypothetical protein
MAKTDESDRNKKELIYYQVDSERIAAESEWAFSQPEVEAVIAETDPDNQASHRVLEKCVMSRFELSDGSIWWKLNKSIITTTLITI